jgi:diguanylate cyclase (GGDEF)-like protein/PAS domain S-box-containing protein
MLSRLWMLILHRIAAKLYLLTFISLAALAVLATVSIHFANQTNLAAERLYQEGVLGVQKVTQLEVLFEQHRALILAAPAELDRGHLQKSRQSVEVLNSRIAITLAERDLSSERFLSQISAQVPTLTKSGNRVLMLADNFAQDEALAESQGGYSQAAHIIERVLKDWNQEQIRTVDREVTGLTKTAQDLNWWVVTAAFTAFVLIGPVTLWAMHRIMSRLGKITTVMHRLCNNELTVDVPDTKSLDEMGDIARSIDVFKYNAIVLEQTHLQLDIALNNMSQGLCFFDGAQRLIVCNSSFSEIYGIAPGRIRPGITLEEIVDLRFEAGSSPAMSKEEYLTWRQTLAMSDVPSDTITELTNGRIIRIRHNPMSDRGWVATHEDITEHRRREASFRLLFESNPVPMWVFDRETLHFLAVNDAAVAQYGYSRERFLTMSISDIRVAQNGDSVSFFRTVPDVQNGEYVGQHQRSDGTSIHVAIYSRVLNYENREARLVAIHDITERKVAEDEVRRMKMFLDVVIENVPMPILVKTAKDSRFMLLNKAGEELFGFNRDHVIGKTPHEVYGETRANYVLALDREALLSDKPVISLDHKIPTSERGIRMVTSKKVSIKGSDGQPEYLLSVIDDVTERREAERQIVHMAHNDLLTDLPNRAAFNECLSATLKLAEADGRTFAIMCMDLDNFKEVNDVYGHAVGDLLLRHVADRLRAGTDGLFVARLGGDEFTIISDNESRSGIRQLADRLLAAFADDFEPDGHRLRQALSIGIAMYPEDGTDAETLMKNADAALYRAKTKNTDSAQFFEAEMAVRLRERAALQADLRLAIQHNELLLHYQPQLKMTGEITGFEALARWYSPKRGMVPPSDFIPLAEESSLILLMGEWVMREACREAASWDKRLRIAINISPIQFRHGDLPSLVHSVLLETGLAPGRLELEITEGVLIDDFSRAVSILRRLKLLGVQIALDDFGTGYSSLSYLHAFPFDKIKIDRTFICDLESNRHSIAIVRAVIGLGRSLHIPILAEGVETGAQYAFLAREGCDEVQGYLTGRPREIVEYAGLVGKKLIGTTYSHAG